MIRVQITTGPDKGKMLEYDGAAIPAEGKVDPEEELLTLFRQGWHWRVVYDDATDAEKMLWHRGDLKARIERAAEQERCIFFQNELVADAGEKERLLSLVEVSMRRIIVVEDEFEALRLDLDSSGISHRAGMRK